MPADLTIIVPIYNEEKTVIQLLKKLFFVLENSNITYQVIAVDDGSKDNTKQSLLSYKSEIKNKDVFDIILHKKNKGKGAAIHSAIKKATGTYTIIQDADLEYDPKDIIEMYTHAKKTELSVLYGSRNKGGNTRGAPLFYWGGRLVTLIANILFKQKMTDEATCYKLIKTNLLKKMPLREKGFAFCPEVTGHISNMNITIKEIPISYNPRSKDEGKKINWRDGVKAIYTMFRIKFSDLSVSHFALLAGFFTCMCYLTTWHMNFGGYEGETAVSALKLLAGEYDIKRAGISATILYIPFIILFRLIGLYDIVWLTLVPIIFSTLTTIGMFYIVWYLTHKKYIALAVSILIGIGSSLWPYANIGMEYQATFYITMLLLTLIRWKEKKGSLFTVGIIFALLATAKSYGPIFGLPIILFIATVHYERLQKNIRIYIKDFSKAIIPAVIAFLSLLIFQYFHYHSFTGVYSLAHEFQIWTWWEGFYGIFFSIGKSIFFFSPLLLLTLFVWKKFFYTHKETATFILVSFLLLLFLTAPFSYWTDETWAVRKLIPILSLLHLPLIFIFHNITWKKISTLLIFITIILSIYIQILGASYSYGKQLNILREGNVDSLHHMRFTPQLSHIPLYHNLLFSYLHIKNEPISYEEETWFRWTRKQEDLVLNHVNIDITSYHTPDIVWLIDTDSSKKYIFYSLLIIDFLLLSIIINRYMVLKKEDV
ncbi:MAG: glycosyltransferase family 2 protein [Candidatus Magasanikbacteria bacterium]|nr:glycosyltransferase family 2 protein [Candidatus Magasanikbacteria bacterium]